MTLKLRYSLFIIGIILIAFGQSGVLALETEKKRSDVRVLVDISGSMKKNDPKNLRIPATRLITNLMPQGSDSGIWTFGRYVNMLVPLKKVNPQWQKEAMQATAKINSAGLYTNIGEAMTRATWDWNKSDTSEARSLILLTDGMVDISKNQQENQKERERILNEVIPKLKKSGVTIHTIALSQDADEALLSTMANQTDGWFTAVDNADELQKIFLKIFEQATPRDSLPLKNNTFKVDASIEEMTLLVFKQEAQSQTTLNTPSKKKITEKNADASVRWFASKSYDLITIAQPEVGEWNIDAAIDPDNRVMIVSNLGLNIGELPNNVLAKEQIQYYLQLLEDGKVIKKPDFLQLIDAKIFLESDGNQMPLPLILDSGSGTFQQFFFSGEEQGTLNINLVVKSPTFERSRTHAVKVFSEPIKAILKQSEEEGKNHKVIFDIVEGVLDVEQLKVTVKVLYPDGRTEFKTLHDWQDVNYFELEPLKRGGQFSLEFKAEGISVTGRKFSTDLPTIEFEDIKVESFVEEEKAAIPEETLATPEETPVVEEETVSEEEPKEDISEEKADNDQEEENKEQEDSKPDEESIPDEEGEPEPKEEDTSLLSTNAWLIIGLIANILFMTGGWFAWKWSKRRALKSVENMTAEITEEESVEQHDDKPLPEGE